VCVCVRTRATRCTVVAKTFILLFAISPQILSVTRRPLTKASAHPPAEHDSVPLFVRRSVSCAADVDNDANGSGCGNGSRRYTLYSKDLYTSIIALCVYGTHVRHTVAQGTYIWLCCILRYKDAVNARQKAYYRWRGGGGETRPAFRKAA